MQSVSVNVCKVYNNKKSLRVEKLKQYIMLVMLKQYISLYKNSLMGITQMVNKTVLFPVYGKTLNLYECHISSCYINSILILLKSSDPGSFGCGPVLY